MRTARSLPSTRKQLTCPGSATSQVPGQLLGREPRDVANVHHVYMMRDPGFRRVTVEFGQQFAGNHGGDSVAF